MFGLMERYAYRMGVRLAHRYLDINLVTSDIHTLIWCDSHFDEAALIFLPVVTKTDTEDFDLQAEIL